MPLAPLHSNLRPIQPGEKVVIPAEVDTFIQTMLRSVQLEPRSGAVVGCGIRLGLTRVDGRLAVSPAAPGLCHGLNQAIRKALAACALCASWSSIQINVDTVAELHRDIDCTGTSLILLAGSFSRGAFRCGDLLLNSTGQLLAFQGSKAHSSDEFGGNRISVVFHSIDVGTDMPTELHLQLASLGFPLPEPVVEASGSSSSCSSSGIRPSSIHRTFYFLYLFAGPERRSSVASFLQQWIFQAGFTEVAAEELDIIRNSADDLLDSDKQVSIITAVGQGDFHAVLTSPACNTFSRAVWSDEVSPHPLRDYNHPWGFPWLGRKDREKCEQANAMVTFSLAVLEAVLAANHRGLDVGAAMEHPEDLGQTVRGRPASIWQLPRTRALAKGGFFTFAFYQCSFGAELAKPTRLLTNIPGLQGGWKAGWPSFDGTGWYLGPLQLPCGHHHPAVSVVPCRVCTLGSQCSLPK